MKKRTTAGSAKPSRRTDGCVWLGAGGPRIGDLLAGGATRILNEGWVLLLGGVLCIAGAWLAAKLQPGFRTYDARNPVP